MHNHLSISSFRAAIATRVLAGAVLAFLFMASINYAANRFLSPNDPTSRMGKLVRHIRGLQQQPSSPSVAFLGSSRFHSAILPDVFRDELKIEDVRFLNWSQPSTSWWEYSKIFERVDLHALDVRCLIIEVNPWTFTTYSRHPITKKRTKYRRETENWGNAEDILATSRLADGVELAYRMYLPRRSLLNWAQTIRLYLNKPESPDLKPPRYHNDIEAETKQRENPDFFPENISICHMLDYEFSQNKAKRFEQFLQDMVDQGHEVILVHPPVVAEYFSYANSDKERRQEFEKHKKFLDELGSKYVFVNWQVSPDAQLTDDIFVDYGHFSFAGASQYSNILANRLKKDIEQAVAHDGL